MRLRLARPVFARLGALTLSVAFAWLLVEVALKLVAPVDYRRPADAGAGNAWRTLLHRRAAEPGLVYELVPGARGTRSGEQIEINSLGQRDREPLPPAPDLRRIAVVGDSSTFGFGIARAEDTYASVLEQRLNGQPNARGLRYDVLNFGVGGYSSQQEAIVLRAKVVPLEPTFTILAYSLNDPEIEPIQPLHAFFAPVELWQRSELLRLVAKIRRDGEIRRLAGGSYYGWLHQDPASWGSVVNAFRSMGETARQAGFPVLLAILPVLPDADSRAGAEWQQRYRFADVARQVAAEGEKNGFLSLDLYPALATRPAGELRVSDADFHPNELGHRLIAEALLAKIEAERARLLPEEETP